MARTLIRSTTQVNGQALSKVDDTNVTLTLGGTVASAVLKAVSLTLGWTGFLAPARGGIGADISGIAKGGVLTGTAAGTIGIKTVGSDDTVLTAASASAGGVAWNFVQALYSSATKRWSTNTNGDWCVGASANVVDSVGTPSVTSQTGGSGAVVLGSYDYAFTAYTGTGNTSFVVTFGRTFASIPCVVVSNPSGGAGVVYGVTASTITFSSFPNGAFLQVIVRGTT